MILSDDYFNSFFYYQYKNYDNMNPIDPTARL